jgi:hypothetical protein
VGCLASLVTVACHDGPTGVPGTDSPLADVAGQPQRWIAKDLGLGNGGKINNALAIVDGSRIWRPKAGWRPLPLEALDIADNGRIVGWNASSQLVTMAPNGYVGRLRFEGLTTRMPVFSQMNAKGLVVGWVEPELLDFRYRAWHSEPENRVRMLIHTFHEFETCCVNDNGEILVREWGGGHGALMLLGGFDLYRNVVHDLYPVAFNNRHEVVGRRLVSDENGNVSWIAFYWSPSTGYVEVSDDPTLIFHALNNHGTAVGTKSGRAFAWSYADGFVDLGPGVATDVNDNFDIVGASDGHTVLWRTPR